MMSPKQVQNPIEKICRSGTYVINKIFTFVEIFESKECLKV